MSSRFDSPPPKRQCIRPLTPPNAPLRLSVREALTNQLQDAFCNADVYVNEEGAVGELVDTHNYYPTPTEIDALITKHAIGRKNRCVECSVDMGIQNPRQYCGKSKCNNH